MPRRSLLQDDDLIDLVDPRKPTGQPRPVFATEDHELIREWAARHAAEPATGEATASGPATVNVQDGGAGIRFNFPAASPFRPIDWDEWFENFARHDLIFVYEEDVPGQPPSARYRLLPRQRLQKRQNQP
ncbi:MAG TPA: hypothetical protein VK886_03965 [Vicinamibacterales bacterium]|nr:hypothetical protein [Vicinamibacterales bacterium]